MNEFTIKYKDLPEWCKEICRAQHMRPQRIRVKIDSNLKLNSRPNSQKT